MEFFNLADGLPENLPFEAYPCMGLGQIRGFRLMPSVILDARFTAATVVDGDLEDGSPFCPYLIANEGWTQFEAGKPDMSQVAGAANAGWTLRFNKREELVVGRRGYTLTRTPITAPPLWWDSIRHHKLVTVLISDGRLDIPQDADMTSMAFRTVTGAGANLIAKLS